ncbi:MAG: hypothetical protein AAF251_04930 [Pseudomonadota bacterium]
MLREAFSLALATVLLGCSDVADRQGPYSVAEVFAAQADLIGKRIKVVGYVGKCLDFNCTVSDHYGILDKPPETLMAIGPSESFDNAVASLEGNPFGRHRIVFEATFSGRCLEYMDHRPMPAECEFRADSLADPVFIEMREAPSSQQQE